MPFHPPLPAEYRDHSGAKLQLEPDGVLYVVRVGQMLAAETLPPQPEGFPLRPEQGAGL